MKLMNDYIKRHKIDSPVIHYGDSFTLLLKNTNSKDKNQLLNATVKFRQETNKPPSFLFSVDANHAAFSSGDMQHVALLPSNHILDEEWNWEDYESRIVNWLGSVSDKYVALSKDEVVIATWKMFIVLNDRWLSSFLPMKLFSALRRSLLDDYKQNDQAIKEIESWLKDNHERVFMGWQKIKNNCNLDNYADWLIKFVNKK